MSLPARWIGVRMAGAALTCAVCASGCSEDIPDPRGDELGPVRIVSATEREGGYWEKQLISDGAGRVRMEVLVNQDFDGADAGMLDIWDGATWLSLNPDGVVNFRGSERPGWENPGPLVARPGTDRFDGLCPGADKSEVRAFLERQAVVYECSGDETNGELILDQATSLVLRSDRDGSTTEIIELDFHPAIDSTTFSTVEP